MSDESFSHRIFPKLRYTAYPEIKDENLMKTVSKCLFEIPYNGNHPREKSFANFANLEAFMNVFLHFLSRPEFLYMRLPESRKFSRELRPRRRFAKLFFRG